MTKKNVLIVSVSILLIVVIGLIVFHCATSHSRILAGRAQHVIESLRVGDYQEATRDFTPALKARVSSEVLKKSWSKAISLYGILKEHSITRMDGYSVYITCTFERGPAWVTVIFDTNNQISQFFIQRP